jgi:branched-chain amino acid transport system ATP-binding protein
MILSVENISKSFSQLNILSNLSFDVKRGELKAVIGPNGAGKTTLFNIISGRFSPDGGRILFNKRDVTQAKPHVLSRMGLARSFQINNFFSSLTTFENIELAVQSRLPRRTSIWRKMPARECEGKTHEVMRLIGLESQAGVTASNLSYGDQRKLEIGLALATEPSLLLLDEPTSGMSRVESRSMLDLIKRLSKRVTIILIEHDIELVMNVSDSILVIHYGEKIAEGTPREIEKNQEVQKVYLGGL